MYCKNCGQKLDKESKFCSKCGTNVSPLHTQRHENISVGSTSTPDLTNENPGSYIPNLIYIKSRRRLYLGYIALCFALPIFFSESNFIANLISGPRTVSESTLAKELESGDIHDININLPIAVDSVYKAGYTHVTQTINKYTKQVESETTDSEYYLTLIDGHVLILEGTANQVPKTNFSGVVMPLSAELRSKISADFNETPELAGMSDTILPYIISDKGMVELGDFWAILFGFIILGFGAFIVYKRKKDPEDKAHYVYQVLATADYLSIADFSRDFVEAQKLGIEKIGGYKLSSKFLFANNFFYFNAYPLSQMFWAYKKVIKKSINLIPTGKDYEIVMHFKSRKIISTKESEKKVNEHLMLLAKMCPNAKFGYTK